MPIGACWARKEVAEAFEPGDHGSTYSGQPLATSAVRAVLQVMEAEDAPGRARKAGEKLRRALEDTPGIASVRGLGLLLGAELEPGRDAKALNLELLHAGLVANAVTPTAIRFAPQLLVSDAEIDEAVSIIRSVLA
jgi:acetylornithine/succinyldiaminopimelate/putrescine aminotransferase